jgi:hypothetical protein
LASIPNIIPIFKALFGNIYAGTFELTKINDNRSAEVAGEKFIKFDATLGINQIFFAVEFFNEFAAEYCFTPVVPAGSQPAPGASVG